MSLNRFGYEAVAWRWLGKAMAWRSVARLADGIRVEADRFWMRRWARTNMRECAKFGAEYLRKHQNETKKGTK